MAYWLLKSDPEEYSFDDLLRERRTSWTGVTNNLALRHLRAMRPGDGVLVYHSGPERAVVGTATVASEPYPDAGGGNRMAVDVEAGHPLPNRVPLAAIRADARLAGCALVRISRLSVMPVDPAEWRALLGMGGEKS